MERLELCGAEIPGAGEVMETLRAEFRSGGQAQKRNSVPARYFFTPLEPLLVEGSPQHGTTGGIQRGSLSAIWEWICRDLLPTMARDYVKNVTDLIGADKQREARQAATTFQTKVAKSMENILSSPESAGQIRSRLAFYTASPLVFDDLAKMLGALRARDELAKLNEALPAKLTRFEDAEIAKITPLLDAFAKTRPEQVPFALMLVAKRLKPHWQLINLATKAASNKTATSVAATPYAVAVAMVLDRLEDKRGLLRLALKREAILRCQGNSGRHLRHRIRFAGPHRSVCGIRLGTKAGCADGVDHRARGKRNPPVSRQCRSRPGIAQFAPSKYPCRPADLLGVEEPRYRQ